MKNNKVVGEQTGYLITWNDTFLYSLKSSWYNDHKNHQRFGEYDKSEFSINSFLEQRRSGPHYSAESNRIPLYAVR